MYETQPCAAGVDRFFCFCAGASVALDALSLARPVQRHSRSNPSTIMSYWLIAVPNERNPSKQLDQLKYETSDLAEVSSFVVPSKQMKVGTLDSLMALSDELAKVDGFIEGVVKKTEKTLGDLVDKDQNTQMFIERDRTTPEQYVQSFEWKHERFNPQTALKDLAASIFQECTVVDEELKTKMNRFTDVKASLAAIERKESGSLAQKPLEGLVTDDVLRFSSEKEFQMVQAVLVVVPKSREEEWKNTYEKLDLLHKAEQQAKADEHSKDAQDKAAPASASEPVAAASAAPAVVHHLTADEQKLADMIKASEYKQKRLDAERAERRRRADDRCANVVPRSCKKITEDEELILFRVFVMTKGVDSFKNACKDRRFTVRTVDHVNADAKQEKDKRSTLESEKNQQLAALIKWCKSAYAELFVSWVHVKAIRVFVESVLRYGLPVNFQAAILKVLSLCVFSV
jgi:hypothetical protein